MTLDRVAVMRKGELQQLDAAEPLPQAGQPLRRRVHRLARDEPRRGGGRRRPGALRRPRAACRRPFRLQRLRGPQGGARDQAEDLEDASLSDAPAGGACQSRSTCARTWARRSSPLLRRRPACRHRGRARRGRGGGSSGGARAASGAHGDAVRRARRPTAGGGDRIEVAVDTRMLHFFDLETGTALSEVGFARGHDRDQPAAGRPDQGGREGVRPPLLVGAERDRPDSRRRCRGPPLLGLRRQALPRLRLAAREHVSIGYGHPKVVAAIKEQAEKLATIGPPMATEPRSTLARMLADVTPGNLKMSFFTNGGAEANENAIKVAPLGHRPAQDRRRYRSYHGAAGGDPAHR